MRTIRKLFSLALVALLVPGCGGGIDSRETGTVPETDVCCEYDESPELPEGVIPPPAPPSTGPPTPAIPTIPTLRAIITVAFSSPDNPDAEFVTRLYQHMLLRAPDSGGLDYWVSALRNGSTRAAVARGILLSPEGRRVTVDSLYRRYLGRAADPQGLEVFSLQLLSGYREEDVVSQLVTSPEYLARRGLPAPTRDTSRTILTSILQDVSGTGFASNNLSLQATFIFGIHTGFVSGNEALRRTVRWLLVDAGWPYVAYENPPRDYRVRTIDRIFRYYLNRPADGQAINAFLDMMNRGARESDVSAQVAGSAEYYNGR